MSSPAGDNPGQRLGLPPRGKIDDVDVLAPLLPAHEPDFLLKEVEFQSHLLVTVTQELVTTFLATTRYLHGMASFYVFRKN
jgi:hypothetical protein